MMTVLELIITGFVGAIIAFIFTVIFGWKGGYRQEKIEQITKLLENCYGPLLVHLDTFDEVYQQKHMKGEPKVLKIDITTFNEIKLIYSKYLHELEDQERHSLKNVINKAEIISGSGRVKFKNDYWLSIGTSHDLITEKHVNLTAELVKYRELRGSVKKNILFSLNITKNLQ